MTVGVRTEINFHDQDTASVLIENVARGDDADLAELVLFVYYAIRQMANLQSTPVYEPLGDALIHAGTDIHAFISALHKDISLVEHPGHAGPKRFVATLDGSDAHPTFKLHSKGFGLLGKGVQYYAPTSVFALLVKFAEHHTQDEWFVHKLAEAAVLCGQAQQQGLVTVGHQNEAVGAVMNRLLQIN